MGKNRKILDVVIEEDDKTNIRQRMLHTENADLDENIGLDHLQHQKKLKYDRNKCNTFPDNQEFFSSVRAYFQQSKGSTFEEENVFENDHAVSPTLNLNESSIDLIIDANRYAGKCKIILHYVAIDAISGEELLSRVKPSNSPSPKRKPRGIEEKSITDSVEGGYSNITSEVKSTILFPVQINSRKISPSLAYLLQICQLAAGKEDGILDPTSSIWSLMEDQIDFHSFGFEKLASLDIFRDFTDDEMESVVEEYEKLME